MDAWGNGAVGRPPGCTWNSRRRDASEASRFLSRASSATPGSALLRSFALGEGLARFSGKFCRQAELNRPLE